MTELNWIVEAVLFSGWIMGLGVGFLIWGKHE